MSSFETPVTPSNTVSDGNITTAKLADNAVTTAKIADGQVALADMANLAQDQFIGRVTASTGVPETATITAAARTVLDDTTVSAMRTTLGLGTLATQSGTFSGTSSGTNTGDQTNISGNAATVTTNANLTGPITSVGNATTVADPELAAIAGLTSAADTVPYFTGSGTAALATFTAAGRALVDDADAAAQRTTLGLGTLATQSGTFSGTSSGTNTGDQTNISGNAATVTTNANLTGPVTSVGNATTIADAELAALAGLTSAADKLPYFTGSGTAALADFTTAGRALVDDASATAQRTTLGLGTLATQSGTFSGTSSGTNTGDQTITLTGDVTGSGTGSFATTIATNSVTAAKFQQIPTATLAGRATAGTGNIEALTLGSSLSMTATALQRAALTGDVTAATDGNATTIANAAVTYAKIQNVAGLSVIGNASDSTGVSGAITTSTLGEVLRNTGTSLTWGTLATAGITNAAVTYAKLQAVAGLSVVGRSANSSGNAADITGTDGQILRVSGTALGFGKAKTSQVTGTATNDDATAGDIGEYVSSSIASASAVTLTTNTSKTITSITLTAGDWDVTGVGELNGSLTGTYFVVAIATATDSVTGSTQGDSQLTVPLSSSAAGNLSLAVPGVRKSISGSTTYYLTATAGFAAGTAKAFGRISARRVR